MRTRKLQRDRSRAGILVPAQPPRLAVRCEGPAPERIKAEKL
jgi:hypothetical protein